MKSDNTVRWTRLDNAAKVFPPTTTERDPKVFRVYCELFDEVDGAILARAVEKALDGFPFFRSVLRRGLFWYYLETSALSPSVHEEDREPCAPLYRKNKKGLLFEVTYYRRRINLEIYHALADGTGAFEFLRAVVYAYLTERHAGELHSAPPEPDYDASAAERQDDSFDRFYTAGCGERNERPGKVYNLRGARKAAGELRVIEGSVSVSEALAAARRAGMTLTGWLVALLMTAIRDDMPLRERRKPIVVTVPVNLRKYYPSASARNFFSFVNLSHRFEEGEEPQKVMEDVRDALACALTSEAMRTRLNSYARFEHNAFARLAPLALKDVSIKIGAALAERQVTVSLSNVGRVGMPAELEPYIRQFGIVSSTARVQLCVCSYRDVLTLGLTSPFLSADIERRFFRALVSAGLKPEITATP